MFELKSYMKTQCDSINAALDANMPQEDSHPSLLHKAMRYSVFSGGKRIRPILCLASSRAASSSDESAILPALALELLHTYTLIHDDLPSMDDDDLRRGQPTSHIKFGEANAILAGDALQALAFSLLSHHPAPANYPPLQLLSELSSAAGSQGVVGGQIEDINHEKKPTFEQIQYIHLHKTACLFRASLRMGAIASNADSEQLEALSNYGTNIGIAFQITDDLLDQDQTNRDELSCLMIYSPDEAAEKAKDLISEATSEISIFNPEHTAPLTAIADFILERQI
jgi:geranylgeranyl diphosphate synthase type II